MLTETRPILATMTRRPRAHQGTTRKDQSLDQGRGSEVTGSSSNNPPKPSRSPSTLPRIRRIHLAPKTGNIFDSAPPKTPLHPRLQHPRHLGQRHRQGHQEAIPQRLRHPPHPLLPLAPDAPRRDRVADRAARQRREAALYRLPVRHEQRARAKSSGQAQAPRDYAGDGASDDGSAAAGCEGRDYGGDEDVSDPLEVWGSVAKY